MVRVSRSSSRPASKAARRLPLFFCRHSRAGGEDGEDQTPDGEDRRRAEPVGFDDATFRNEGRRWVGGSACKTSLFFCFDGDRAGEAVALLPDGANRVFVFKAGPEDFAESRRRSS